MADVVFGRDTGTIDATGRVSLTSDESRWILHPAWYLTVNLEGQLVDGDRLLGRVQGAPRCSSFTLQRVDDPPPQARDCRLPEHLTSRR